LAAASFRYSNWCAETNSTSHDEL